MVMMKAILMLVAGMGSLLVLTSLTPVKYTARAQSPPQSSTEAPAPAPEGQGLLHRESSILRR